MATAAGMSSKIHNETLLGKKSAGSCFDSGRSSPLAFDPAAKINTWTGLLQELFTDVKPGPIVDFLYYNWHVSVYISVVYLLLVYYGTRWMKNRPAFDLRLTLAAWSGLLAAGSIWGSLVVVPEFFRVLYEKGFVATYCDNCYIQHKSVVFWYTVFSLSKVLELFDTAFIVLRKQKLIPLHWVHHTITLIYTFYIYGYMAGPVRWMVCMNIVVHSIMYAYYSLKALRFRIPRPVAMSITTIQVVQMFFGFYIHLDLMWKLSTGYRHCDAAMSGVFPGLLMYLLYVYFFVKFFIDSYFGKRTEKPKKPTVIMMKIDQNETSDGADLVCPVDKLNNNGQIIDADHLKMQ